MDKQTEVIVYLVVAAIFLFGGLIRKVLEKAGKGGRVPVPGPRPPQPPAGEAEAGEARNIGKEIRDFLEELGRGPGGGEREGRAPLPGGVPPQQVEPRRPAAQPPRPKQPVARPVERLGTDLSAASVTRRELEPTEAAAMPGAKKKAARGGKQEHRPARAIPLLGEGADRRRTLRELVAWTEVLGQPRSRRAWRPMGPRP